jgi:hypothetical protein
MKAFHCTNTPFAAMVPVRLHGVPQPGAAPTLLLRHS